MCGIIGYIGKGEALQVLLEGLKKLEYRGYDSAGVALANGEISLYKKKGKVAELERLMELEKHDQQIGIGHTRWATHGEPCTKNAHPHQSQLGIFSIVHNGIIENYAELQQHLAEEGYTFQSETDTEVLVNLVESVYRKNENCTTEEAVRLALKKVVGAYGIAVLCENEPEKIVVARKGSPLLIGLGVDEYFVASDVAAIAERTSQVIYLNDDDLAILQADSCEVKSLANRPKPTKICVVDNRGIDVDKGDFEHFMLKEIYEQPKTIIDSMRGRIAPDNSEIVLGGLADVIERVEQARRIIIVGCGTSWHAALVAEYLIEQYAQIPVEVEYASEFRYRNPVLSADDVVVLISQSGETADTLAALQLAKEKGVLALGICNVPGSSLARETEAGVFTHAGVEIGVASTKAFSAQLTVLTLFALKLARKRNTISDDDFAEMVSELRLIPEKIKKVIDAGESIKKIASKYFEASNSLYLGRGILFPVALEGALKLKEISYIHAEGYAAGEMKHGPIALVDEQLPVVVLATSDAFFEKVLSNVQEIKARKGKVIAIINEKENELVNIADDCIEIPKTHPALVPLLAVIPQQLMAYHIALLRGCNVDQPRNLAKSVTVE